MDFRHARAVVTRTLGVAVVAWLVVPASARAQDDACAPRDGFSTCIASDNLWPQPGGGPFVTQAPTQLPPRFSGTVGVVPTFYMRPIGFQVASPDPEGSTVYAVDRVLAATFLAGFSPADRLQVQLAVPAILFQDGAGKTDVVGAEEELPHSALGDLRLGVQYAFFARAHDGGPGLSARFEIAAPTGRDDAFAGYPSTTWAPGIAFDYRLDRVLIGADLGARIRAPAELAGATLGSQISASLGASVDILDDGWLSAAAELWALFTLASQTEITRVPGTLETESETAPPHIPMEWLASVRTAGLFDGRFRISAGAGGLVPTAEHTAVTSPAVRVVLGVHHHFD
jgi:hypothetical protein